MTHEQLDKLAVALADGLFACDRQQERPTTRIQFMSGEYPDKERAEGGLCHSALVSVFQAILQGFVSE